MNANEYPDFFEKGNPPCTVRKLDTFFPEKEDKNYRQKTALAKEVCRTCPYMAECLEWALKYEEFGVWGGTSPEDRKTMKRSRRTSIITSIGDPIIRRR